QRSDGDKNNGPEGLIQWPAEATICALPPHPAAAAASGDGHQVRKGYSKVREAQQHCGKGRRAAELGVKEAYYRALTFCMKGSTVDAGLADAWRGYQSAADELRSPDRDEGRRKQWIDAIGLMDCRRFCTYVGNLDSVIFMKIRLAGAGIQRPTSPGHKILLSLSLSLSLSYLLT
ncbi:hypothetical protein THAOC_26083, partial [Thalassiosira oceanica]